MKKITTLSILIFFLISVNNCAGYKPIFASGDLNFTIQDSKIDGDKIIGGRIYSNLERLSSKNTEKGNTKIEISIKKEEKNYLFELKDRRKFDYETLKYLNKEDYIKKISF